MAASVMAWRNGNDAAYVGMKMERLVRRCPAKLCCIRPLEIALLKALGHGKRYRATEADRSTVENITTT